MTTKKTKVSKNIQPKMVEIERIAKLERKVKDMELWVMVIFAFFFILHLASAYLIK